MKSPAGFIRSYPSQIIKPYSKPEPQLPPSSADAISGIIVVQEEWAEEWKRSESESE